MLQKRALPLGLLIFVAVAVAQTPAKRPLNHRDYDKWKSIQSQALSRDGKFLAYALFPQEGDGELVVRNLATGKEMRESVGAVPAPPDNTNFEAPAGGADAAAARNLRMSFTHDNRFLIATAFPSKAATDQARKERKRPDEMPRTSMLIVDLGKMSAARVEDVASFQTAVNGPSLIAYLRGPKPGERATPAATPENNDSEFQGSDFQGRGGGRAGAPGGRGGRRTYGSDLIVRNLSDGKEGMIEEVLDYSMSEDGATLVYTVGSKKEETNGVYALVPGTDTAPTPLLAGKGKYSRLTWDLTQKQLAFVSDRDDAAGRPAKYKLYLWNRKAGAPVEIVSTSTAGFRDGYGIAEGGQLSFSRDGARLFLSTAPATSLAALAAGRDAAETPAAPAQPGEEKVLADLWHYKDDYVQPMQKVRAQQERSRSYRAVYHIAEKKFVQLADPTMPGANPSDDGKVALGTDDRAYRKMVDYDGTYSDMYAIDTTTGARRKLLEKARGGGGGGGGGRGGGGPVSPLSPDGKWVTAFRDNHWWAVRVSDAKMVNLTASLNVAFQNEDHDTPDVPNGYGNGGWTKDSKWVLLYDRYDVWAAAPENMVSQKLTSGRESKIQFRVVRLDRAADDEEERGIDPEKPLLLRAENLETRDTGFYSLAKLDGSAQPKKLLMGAKSYRTVAKAKDADVVLLTATTFRDQPDLHVTDSTFAKLQKVTDANPQQAQLLWGSGELIKYRNADGVELQAALYKPENFDPSRRYPMMVYIYERLSQNVHNFVRPQPGTSINMAYYVSNGYLVLTPDIIYTTGHPGQSALKCVLPAVQAVVEKGFVNRNAIGIQGHSWGGYQIAYMLTQTNVFKAAEAGAPVANMISAYDGIRWGTGLPRQFQYEKTQSRIGGSIWEYPMRFLENSPIFHMDRVQTPVLILHDDGDDAVPWYQGIEMFLSLRRMGKEAYLFNYNGEAHGLRKRPNQKDFTVRMQQFFDHLLKDTATPEWMEKGIPYIDREKEKEKINSIYSEAPDKPGDKKQ
ncbi:MAG TPA: prolyl oligopeptidase family serine peptidase [Bryobacteraceae bacterium]|nr:prolyl oligopeptidase family serine peptidase [Bryobacteraceae bacterium]